MEQIVIVLLFLAFSGAEAFFRWLKKRQARGDRPAPPRQQREPRPVIVEEDDEDDPDWLEVLREQQAEQRKREDEAKRARQAQPVEKREAEREPYEFVIRQRAPEPASAPKKRAASRFNAAERPVSEGPRPRTEPTPAEAALAAQMARRAAAGTGRRKVRVPVREWLRGRQDLRRGVVLMEILGKPKGLS